MDDRLLVFIHIPKTAGSTLRAIMQRQYRPEEICHIHWDFDRNAPFAGFLGLPEQERARTKVLYGHIPFGVHRQIQRQTTYFTMLRDPVDRCISHYFHIRKLPNHFHHKRAKELDLGEFVASGVFREMDNGQVRQLTGAGGLPFGTCTPDLLDQAIANLEEHFCVVGLQERFDETLLLLRRAMRWRQLPLYQRRNVGKLRSHRDSFSPEVLGVVETHNALDQQLYDYVAGRLAQTITDQGAGFALEYQAFSLANRLVPALAGLRQYLRRSLKPSLD